MLTMHTFKFNHLFNFISYQKFIKLHIHDDKMLYTQNKRLFIFLKLFIIIFLFLFINKKFTSLITNSIVINIINYTKIIFLCNKIL